MIKSNLKIYYTIPQEGVMEDMENDLILVLEKYGFVFNKEKKEWAEQETKPHGIRGLSFDKHK